MEQFEVVPGGSRGRAEVHPSGPEATWCAGRDGGQALATARAMPTAREVPDHRWR
jgi:hypothetical protein